jgi:hypothetical protein
MIFLSARLPNLSIKIHSLIYVFVIKKYNKKDM